MEMFSLTQLAATRADLSAASRVSQMLIATTLWSPMSTSPKFTKPGRFANVGRMPFSTMPVSSSKVPLVIS